MKLNCWELKKCGREPRGKRSGELGICPAAVDERYDTTNSGKNGGRICWQVLNTLCGGQIQKTQEDKNRYCSHCIFPKIVEKEEGNSFKEKQ